MARYSLILKSQDRLETFVVPFGKNEKGLITKVDLQEIDLFTSSFASFLELTHFIQEKYDVPFTPGHFMIQYMYNGDKKYLDVFVHNDYLKKCASASIQRKKKLGNSDLTEETLEFVTFVKRILHYMGLSATMPLIQDDSYHLVPFVLQKEVKKYYELAIQTFHTPTSKTELLDIRDRVFYVLSKYKNMRGMLKWEQLYLSGKIKKYKRNVTTFSTRNVSSSPIEEEEDLDEYAFLSEEERNQMLGYESEATYRRWK